MVQTLDSIIETILMASKEPLSVREITERIKKKKLWYRKDGQLPPIGQVRARVSGYKQKFLTQNGVVMLVNKPVNERRIARITFNTNGWVMPSGPYGKSRNTDSHEGSYGYGHEEWLFDISKLIKGQHYGFLEPVHKQHQAFAGKTFDIWLYTIDGHSKIRYMVGKILNVKVLTTEEAALIKKEYTKRKWMAEMEGQIKASGAKSSKFSNWKGVEIFNIRFLPRDIRMHDPYVVLPADHPLYFQSRYSFTNFKDEFDLNETNADNFRFWDNNKREKEQKGVKSVSHMRQPKMIEITYLHEAISKQLTGKLKELSGTNNVSREHPAGYSNNQIDIVVRNKSGFSFYEIKTYPSMKVSIREAIGQLMEYSFWTKSDKANELIIVTQPHYDFEKARIYFKHLRKRLNIPLYYQSFDIDTGILSEKV